MRYSILVLLFVLGAFYNLKAQNSNKDILLTIADKPVFTDEFLRVYNKNLDLVQDDSQKDVEKYLQLFVNYKLKLAEAKALEYDKKPSYIRELNGYKKQLAKNYLTDHEVTEDLVREAYERISYDINASHILIKLEPHITDTIAVYNQMLKLREIFVNEPDFSKVQKQVHNGNNVLAEELGYFSGFKMIYDFETVAFNTPVGEVSQPFRTQFGYHVVKVHDKRKSRGEVTVGHIMVIEDQKDSLTKPEDRINEIYKMIQQGGEFESLAKQFSDDKSSAAKGGRLSAFKSGQLTSVIFEDEAFKLNSPGEISKPFKSDYGWHIVKLYEKKPVEPFEILKHSLEARVKRDPRSARINEAFMNKLRSDYNISLSNTKLNYFESILDESFFEGKWNIPTDIPQDEVLLKIGDKQLMYTHFAEYLASNQKRVKVTSDITSLINQQYSDFVNKKLLIYHEENLENTNQDFANVLNEYRDGLLLFDLMETKIWNEVKNDTIGLQDHFNENESNYYWEERVDVIIASSSKKDVLNKIVSMLEKGESIETINNQVNNGKSQNVIFTKDLMNLNDRRLPKAFKPVKGISDIYNYNNAFHVIKVNEVIPKTQKSFEEAKGAVITDFQNVVEQRWLNELSKKFKVIINQEVLNKIKAQIKN